MSRTHGSAVFTRGETQALAVVTLGTPSDEQKIETLVGETFKSFMLHYNFPPYSVGETRPLRGPSRREIGHGALAERAISQVLPTRGRVSLIPSASFRRSSPPTAPPRWPRSAAPPCP